MVFGLRRNMLHSAIANARRNQRVRGWMQRVPAQSFSNESLLTAAEEETCP